MYTILEEISCYSFLLKLPRKEVMLNKVSKMKKKHYYDFLCYICICSIGRHFYPVQLTTKIGYNQECDVYGSCSMVQPWSFAGI